MKFSIVTTVYNGEKYIEKTIKSVLSQTYTDFEYIIIDGGSTDSTVEIIKKYQDKLSYWVSERDNGMYNGINKGFSNASGEVFSYLNADDLYLPNTLDLVNQAFLSNNVDLVTGHTHFIDENDFVQYSYKGLNMPKFMIKALKRLPFSQQSTFWKRSVYFENHGFNETYKYVSDSDFFMKSLLLSNMKYLCIPHYLSCFRWHNENFSTVQSHKMELENDQMILEYKGNRLLYDVFVSFFADVFFKLVNLRGLFRKRKNKVSRFHKVEIIKE